MGQVTRELRDGDVVPDEGKPIFVLYYPPDRYHVAGNGNKDKSNRVIAKDILAELKPGATVALPRRIKGEPGWMLKLIGNADRQCDRLAEAFALLLRCDEWRRGVDEVDFPVALQADIHAFVSSGKLARDVNDEND